MEIIPFGSQDLDNILAREPQRAEYLPFGAVMLDRQGKIVKYNRAEGMIANKTPEDMIGKDFFNEVAPCAKGKRFDYKFAYKGTNVGVKIHLKSQPDGQHCWMFVKRV